MRKDLTQQRREEIIDAARKCFMSRGFHATGMTDIAREFGMSTGHIDVGREKWTSRIG